MKAIAQKTTKDLVAKVNALQEASPKYIDPSSLTQESREWRLMKRDIDALFRVDARDAWEVTGMWHALSADAEGMENAFANSIALGHSETNCLNLMVNRLNLANFSGAQEQYGAVGAPEANMFSTMVIDGFKAGAFQTVAAFIGRLPSMGIDWQDAGLKSDALDAAEILQKAGISDADVAKHLDIAGGVLKGHGIRPKGGPRVTVAPGFFEAVTFQFEVPVSAKEAFEMNVELAIAEDEAGIPKDVHFDVVFGATA